MFKFLTAIGLFSLTLFASGCSDKQAPDIWNLNERCDLHTQACSSEKNGVKVTLSISPNQPIPIAKKLDVKVSISGLAAKQVQLDITGTNMYMGYNRVELPFQKEGVFEGNAMFAFCTNQSMDWLLSVMILDKNGNIIQVPFSLTTQNQLSK